jgi:hypothetical protein
VSRLPAQDPGGVAWAVELVSHYPVRDPGLRLVFGLTVACKIPALPWVCTINILHPIMSTMSDSEDTNPIESIGKVQLIQFDSENEYIY